MSKNQNKTVLVVEDEEDMRQALVARLEADGHRVLEAADADGGLKQLAEEAVDLVLLDLRLGEKSGLEVLSEVSGRHLPGGKRPIVLVLSAIDDPSVRAKVMGMGVPLYNYLIKMEHSLDDIAAMVATKLADT